MVEAEDEKIPALGAYHKVNLATLLRACKVCCRPLASTEIVKEFVAIAIAIAAAVEGEDAAECSYYCNLEVGIVDVVDLAWTARDSAMTSSLKSSLAPVASILAARAEEVSVGLHVERALDLLEVEI